MTDKGQAEEQRLMEAALTIAESLADVWDSFEDRVLPRNAGPIQRSEMKRSFFAGALTGALWIDRHPERKAALFTEIDLFREAVERDES